MKNPVAQETRALSRDERIGALAYQIWEEEGRPDGRSEVHWYVACEMIDAEDAAAEPLPTWLNKQDAKPQAEERPASLELKKKSAA
jgi:hypothetical protein